MRKGRWLAALIVSLSLAVFARAQNTGSSFITGVNPHDLTFKPIDVSKAAVPAPPTPSDSFSFRHLFSKVIPGLSPAPPVPTSSFKPSTSFPAPPGPKTMPTLPLSIFKKSDNLKTFQAPGSSVQPVRPTPAKR
jgi:hypothetical protein